MGGLDGEGVGAVAEQHGEVLEPGIRDAAWQRAAGDDVVVSHAQSGETCAGEGADVGGRAVGVVHDQDVDLGRLDGLGSRRGDRQRVT